MIFLIAACVVSSALPLLLQTKARLAIGAVCGSSLIMFIACTMSIPVLIYGPMSWAGGIWRLDRFAALLLLLVGFIQWTAVLVSVPYINHELHEDAVTHKQASLYYALLQLFVLSMVLTLTADSVGLMWVSLEGTTLATTTLVAFHSKAASLEAAWKYILLCSLGISLGLLGVLLVFYAAAQAGITNPQALNWTFLAANASIFSPNIMRLAFIFIFIGYGTKVGLAPMHAWLPDAHGHTPSPISALLSGVLLNIALFAILRFKNLTDLAVGNSAWSNNFFLFFGALSFILPAGFIIIQRDYKRLLAYSSIEHMGFIVFSLGLGAIGRIAAIIHLIGHSLTKSMLFFGTGNILQRYKTTVIERIHHVIRHLPYSGTLFLIGLLMILAAPPSPLFLSELLTFSAAITQQPIAAGLLLLAGTIIFAGMLSQLIPMLYSSHIHTEPVAHTTREKWGITHTVMAGHLAVIAVFGVSLMFPFAQNIILRIAESIK